MPLIRNATFAPYRLRFRTPLETAKGLLRIREGIVVTVEDHEGRLGQGDAAPLAEFSTETLEDTRQSLQALCQPTSNLYSIDFAVDSEQALIDRVDQQVRAFALPASAAHAIESAILSLLAQRAGLSMADVLATDNAPRRTPPIHAIAVDPASAEEALRAGFSTLKIKVGGMLEQDVARVAAIRVAVGDSPVIRLDANGAWNEAQAVDALRRFAPYRVHSVEEPIGRRDRDKISHCAALARLRRERCTKIAADESVRTLADVNRLIAHDAVDAIVIKPMFVGGLIPSLKMAQRASEGKLALSVTTSFESHVGQRGAYALACAVPGDLWSCGLSTDRLLEG